jgi:hypothetical protein
MTPRRTAKEISDLVIAQLETSLSTSIPLLPKSFCRVLAKAIGGVFVMLYQYAGDILMQMFVKYASNEPRNVNGVTITPLKEWGDLVGIYQAQGVRAERTVEITVLTQGGTISSGARIANPATQMIYTVVGDVSLNASTVRARIRATKVGELGNVDTSTMLHFVSAPDEIEKEVVVVAPVSPEIDVAGEDPESTELFREHIQEFFMARPQGGAMQDYRNWAEETPGVKNAYPYSGWADDEILDSRAGQVFLFIESVADLYGIPDPLPGGALLNAVKTYVENDTSGLAARRTINTYVQYLPITRTVFDVSISGLFSDDDVTTQAEIEAELAKFFLGREPGGQAGYTILLPKRDIVARTEVGGIVSRIAAAHNGLVTNVGVSVSGTYQEFFYLQEGEKARIGTVSWN